MRVWVCGWVWGRIGIGEIVSVSREELNFKRGSSRRKR